MLCTCDEDRVLPRAERSYVSHLRSPIQTLTAHPRAHVPCVIRTINRCENSTAWFNCAGKDAGRCAAKGAPGKCNTHKGSGHLLTDKVKLPAGFRSNHTLLGFRWDCEDTPQLWVQCADIAIV